MKAGIAALALLAGAMGALAQEEVRFASSGGEAAVQLQALYFPVAAPRAPAVLLLHGCGGMFDARGRLGERMREYAGLINGLGAHALVLDSFGPRGVRELCTQAPGTRRVTQAQRRPDTLAALAWLAARPEVDASRLGLIGWSNGGSAVLASTNRRHVEVERAARPAFAVAFYPGCEAEGRRGYHAATPLLMLLGEADDWTPSQPCVDLAARAWGERVEVERYADAHHGFDSSTPVRLRRDVPGGAHPGQGVHVGGDPAARAAARERLMRFLRERLS